MDNLPCVIENMNSAIYQAEQYADALKQKYAELNLKSFAVVARGLIGFHGKQLMNNSTQDTIICSCETANYRIYDD